jgi:hypothetical protein
MVVHGTLVHSPPVALALDEQRAHVFVVTVGPLITSLTRSGSGMVIGTRIRSTGLGSVVMRDARSGRALRCALSA